MNELKKLLLQQAEALRAEDMHALTEVNKQIYLIRQARRQAHAQEREKNYIEKCAEAAEEASRC